MLLAQLRAAPEQLDDSPVFGRRFSGLDSIIPATGSMLCGAAILVPLSIVIDRPWTLEPSRASLSALLGLVVVEQYNATSGIGHMITLAEQYGQTDVIVVGLVIYGVFGYLADTAVRLTERKVLAWRRTLEG